MAHASHDQIVSQFADLSIGLGRAPVLVEPRTATRIESPVQLEDVLRDAPPAVSDALWRQLVEQTPAPAPSHRQQQHPPAALTRSAVTTHTTQSAAPTETSRPHLYPERTRTMKQAILDAHRNFVSEFGCYPTSQPLPTASLERQLSDRRDDDPTLVILRDALLADAEHQARIHARSQPSEAPDPDAAPLDPMELLNLERLADAKRALEFRNSDAGRQERQIELLERVVELLEERR